MELPPDSSPAPDQADQLLDLLDTCHRVLPKLASEDSLARLLREICQAVEKRLRKLNEPPPDVADAQAD